MIIYPVKKQTTKPKQTQQKTNRHTQKTIPVQGGGTSLIPALGGRGSGISEFHARLVYTADPRPDQWKVQSEILPQKHVYAYMCIYIHIYKITYTFPK